MSIRIFRPLSGTQAHRVRPHQIGDEQLPIDFDVHYIVQEVNGDEELVFTRLLDGELIAGCGVEATDRAAIGRKVKA
jgi:formamidopyrimidine-DNA glycosylase